MKKILLLLTLIASSAFAADPTLIIIDRDKDKNGNAKDVVTIFGILNDGKAKTIELTSSSDTGKVTTFENSAQFNLNRETKRIVIYFRGSDVRLVDFQMKDPFGCKTFRGVPEIIQEPDMPPITLGGFEPQSQTNFSAMKSMILNKVQ